MHPYRTCIVDMDIGLSVDIHAKSVDMDMDMDMDGKFHIHGIPGHLGTKTNSTVTVISSVPCRKISRT